MIGTVRFVIAIACAGCAVPAPPATVTTMGTIGGRWTGLVAAAAQIETGPRGSMLVIALSTLPDACSALAESETVAGSAAIELSFSKPGTGPNQFVPGTDPGTYATDAAGPPPWVSALVLDRDTSCAPTTAEGYATGTATISSADASGYEGAFALVLVDGEQLNGTFHAESCTWNDAVVCR
jgi:hypothetical protein